MAEWTAVLTDSAQKSLERIPTRDRARIEAAIVHMAHDPFFGDVKVLRGTGGAMRRRVGSYRVLFDLDRSHRCIVITAIARRTSTTY